MTLFICYVFHLNYNYVYNKSSDIILEESHNNESDSIDYNIHDSISNMIIQFRILYPDIVYKQAVIESGNFKSDIFINNNNPFGMRMPQNRATTALYSKKGYAYYNNIRDGVIDYALFQNYIIRQRTRDEYLNYLQRNYAEDSHYRKKIE